MTSGGKVWYNFPRRVIMGEQEAIKLVRRLIALSLGRHCITLSVTADGADWTITYLGKIEH